MQKYALPDEVCAKRFEFAKHLRRLGQGAGYYHRNVIWTDLCSSIIPKTAKRAHEQALARKGGKGWGSPGARLYTRNLKGNRMSLKMKSTDSLRWWWMPLLMRGKLHIELLPEDFPGECAAGARVAVSKIPAALSRRFRSEAKPRIVMTDKGKGFYHGTGRITDEYKTVLSDCGLRPLMGESNTVQPGDCQELMLHETAVAWVRRKLEHTLPVEPWRETRDAFEARLKQASEEINEAYDVAGLCHEFPERVEALFEAEGGRICK
jgi:hypothetical protein